MSQRLDALTFPLWGSRLIEASAGTGKTWTIAALYLRLVLGHGGENGFKAPLVPSEILVMTFTRAATRELSDRVRSRLMEAARVFRGESREGEPAPDALLSALLAAHPPGPARAAAAWRLAMAAESMDDAAVHTIDAWCQRMLREHAFDSGCLFDEELVANLQAMQHEAVQDYWRQQVYPMDGPALDLVLSVWRNVDALEKDVKQLVERAPPAVVPGESLEACVARLEVARRYALADLKRGWAARAREMKAWLDTQMVATPDVFDKKKFRANYYVPWFEALDRWASDPAVEKLDLKKGLTRLTPAGLEEVMRPGGAREPPAHFAAFEQLVEALGAMPSIAAGLRAHAAAAIAQRLTDLKRQAGTFGFADMLSRLDQALDPQVNGAKADRLRERILAQYPVALVDEFQDTSPVQSRIFDRLYRIASNDRHTALLLIGDPKQSIYGFRGADILSYLHTRRATEGRHYALDTNHRSTHAMVSAASHLFETAETREGDGAFMFRSDAANPLPFTPVVAHGRAESFVTSGGACPAMTLHFDDRLHDADTSRRIFAARCAERIVALLNDDRAGFVDPVRGFAPLRPAQIAVLVPGVREANTVRRELRRRHVPSVYLSDKESVFESAEARDLLHWLRAVASPLDARLVRAALATGMVGLPIAELLRLAEDDEAFEGRSEQMRTLHGVWREQGVLTMLRRSLHQLQLPARWLGPADAGDGERRLTNLLHLAELLQDASALQEGEQALVRWFAEQVTDPSDANDDEIVRLESDADLVQVITVHKSKGLEYPLVFLPFASSFRAIDRKSARHLWLADDEGRRTLHLDLGDAQLKAAERDRQREELRLLYVAITRARHVAWVGLALPKLGGKGAHELHRSALGYALAGTERVEAQRLGDALRSWAQPCAQIAVVSEATSAAPSVTPLAARAQPSALHAAPPYAGRFDTRWSIGSFSAVVRNIASSTAWAVAAAREDENVPLDAPTEAPRSPARQVELAFDMPWHGFPRGATPGNFLHGQLEWLAGEGFDLNASADRQQQLLRRCERQGWGHRRDDTLAWLSRIVATPLPAVGAPLERIDALLPEMEFWFPSDGLVSSRVDKLCRTHLLGGRARPALPEHSWRGMLMGFADLVFEHGGRYWVLDYKSNHLGPTDADYANANLEAAMAAHRYDVQAALYLLALHRLLRARLGAAYDPSHHLGGALFFFLRGLDGPTRGCYVIAPPLKLLGALDDALRQPAGSTP